MRDLKSPWLMGLKAVLLVGIGLLASFCLLAPSFSWRNLFLLALAIWGFSRAYYFLFYVIQNYIDPEYRFSGIGSFVSWIIQRTQKSSTKDQ